MKQMGQVPLLSREQEVAISRRIEAAESKIAGLIHGFGFAAKEYIAIAEKLLSDPPKERFDRVVLDQKIDGKEAHLRALQKLAEEDPTFRVRTDAGTGQTIISGMGELHLEIIVDRLLREFKVEANVGKPQVAYRETAGKPVSKVEGKFVRQTGGHGQYGHVVFDLEPLEPAEEEAGGAPGEGELRGRPGQSNHAPASGPEGGFHRPVEH